ncbi:MAG: arginase family protein, partial [Planctomycetota bacterium]|nr:arginase family protein [Planctomycetota bacterium]
MAEELFQPPWNFMGLPESASNPRRARAWVLPIPYEATTSYGAGTREGPAAIIAASRQVEWYDRRAEAEACLDYGIHTLPPLALVHTSPEQMVAAIARAVAKVLRGVPRPQVLGILGGEHSLSAGVAQGMAKALGAADLVCVHIDAHADLRQEYEGSKYSHACAARRILEVCPVFQIGIRNLSAGEEKFRRACRRVHTVFSEEANAPEARFLEDLARFVAGK